jgi:hypothetical protein
VTPTEAIVKKTKLTFYKKNRIRLKEKKNKRRKGKDEGEEEEEKKDANHSNSLCIFIPFSSTIRMKY